MKNRSEEGKEFFFLFLSSYFLVIFGAGDGIRTRDLQLGKLTLYH